MPANIHKTAIIDPTAKIGEGTVIGAYVTIEKNVIIGKDNRIETRVYIGPGTTLGDKNRIHMGAIVGHEPQDLAYNGEETYTRIGNNNEIREYSTIHRGTKEGTTTEIGDDNFLMAYTHVAHNCKVGNKVVMVNNASLTGYCEVGDGALLSGFVGLHQFTKIGTLAVISALSAPNKDIPPFMMAGGRPALVQSINLVGMKRAGFTSEERSQVKQAFKFLYKSGLNTTQALEEIKKTLKLKPIQILVDFIENSDRGIAAGLGIDTEKSIRKTEL